MPITDAESFLKERRPTTAGPFTAVSLFSGAGLSDMGYLVAGFRVVVQVELDARRAALGQDNFPNSHWINGDVRKVTDEVIRAFRDSSGGALDLLVATPPCQGMSSSNPSRGRRHTERADLLGEKNTLVLSIVPSVKALLPRVFVVENVRQLLTLTVATNGQRVRVLDRLAEALPNYRLYEGTINVADYGVPQDRRRAILVGVRADERWGDALGDGRCFPWPRPTHAEKGGGERLPWVSVRQWFEQMRYEPLSAQNADLARGTNALHFVPHYDEDRFLLVSSIPPDSGRSAYESDTCPQCGHAPVPRQEAVCPQCQGVMRNRPHVRDETGVRLIRGFRSSYRRMHPDLPAATITTNSSHVGSDCKIHPWEPRVLSILECADLQTVPRWYDWSRAIDDGTSYLIRNVVGEALPPFFTYLHGRVLSLLLAADPSGLDELATSNRGLGHRKARGLCEAADGPIGDDTRG